MRGNQAEIIILFIFREKMLVRPLQMYRMSTRQQRMWFGAGCSKPAQSQAPCTGKDVSDKNIFTSKAKSQCPVNSVSIQIRYLFVLAFVEQGNPDNVCITSLAFSSYLKCLVDTSNAVEDN